MTVWRNGRVISDTKELFYRSGWASFEGVYDYDYKVKKAKETVI